MDVKEILAYVCFAGLDDSPATEALELKSSPHPGLLNGILPLNLSQKAEKIGQQIQYRLSNLTGAHLIVYQVRR